MQGQGAGRLALSARAAAIAGTISLVTTAVGSM
jgi:hypothetical protein